MALRDRCIVHFLCSSTRLLKPKWTDTIPGVGMHHGNWTIINTTRYDAHPFSQATRKLYLASLASLPPPKLPHLAPILSHPTWGQR